MAWRNCEQYSLEKCGPGKPCQFNGPVNYTCSGRTLPEPERRDIMPKKKKTKKKPVEKKARKTPVDQLDNVRAVSSAQELPEEPAISLVGRVEELLTDINQLHEQVNEQEQRVATLKDRLRGIKFDNGKLSVEFGWNEGPETPGVRVGIFSGREFAYIEASLEELGEMVEWCKGQLG
jgi:hypothetical protein